jgi:hypothetical protein
MRSSLAAVVAFAVVTLSVVQVLPECAAGERVQPEALKSAKGGESPPGAGIPIKGLRQIFKAGFEEPVTLAPNWNGTEAWLKGVDSGGMAWETLDHVFELVANNSFDNLVTIRFAHVFAGSRSLFLRQNKQENGTQVRLQFFSDDKSFGTEIFTRRHYFIPSTNLSYLAREEESASIAGTRETRGGGVSFPANSARADFSMPLFLVRRGNNLVFAQAIADYSAGPWWSNWTSPPKGLLTYGRMTPCPLDRWFQLDIYILRDAEKGKIKVWLDNELIFDLVNVRTKNDTASWFTKLADVDSEPAPFELWVDNVEIWSR